MALGRERPGCRAAQALCSPGSHRTGKSTMSLILSLQIKLRKEKRLSWMMRTLGSRHSISCLEASRCCLHLGQYLGTECARYQHGDSLKSHSPAPRCSPTRGAGRGDARDSGIALCWLRAFLPSAQARPAQNSWLPEETAYRPRQLLGNSRCCLCPRAGTHPAAFLTTLPLGPGLQAW